MNTEIIIALIGILSTATSSWITWFLTRKKYNSEVDLNLILNMKESLDFYKLLSDDNKSRLEEILRSNYELELRNDRLEEEMKKLRDLMFTLMSLICLDLSCKIRQKGLYNTKLNETVNKKNN